MIIALSWQFGSPGVMHPFHLRQDEPLHGQPNSPHVCEGKPDDSLILNIT